MLGNSNTKVCQHTVNHVAKIGPPRQKIGNILPCRQHVADMLPTFAAKGGDGEKAGFGGIGQYNLPRSTLRCMQRIPPQLNMLESNRDKLDWLSFAQRHGALLNKRGGYYRQGKQYGMEKKLAVADTTTSNAHLLVAICNFIVGFVSFVVIIHLHAVVVDFVDDREPDATVWPCTRILGLLLN